MDDMRAVLDTAGSERAALFGISEGGPMCTMFAATYRERTSALVLCGTIAVGRRDENYPWAASQKVLDRFLASIQDRMGGGRGSRRGSSLRPSPMIRSRCSSGLASNGARSAPAGCALCSRCWSIPTCGRSCHSRSDIGPALIERPSHPVEGGRYIAQRIPGAKYVELRCEDHFPLDR